MMTTKVILIYFSLFIDSKTPVKLDNQPGVDQPEAAGPAKKTDQAVQPPNRDRESVKRKLNPPEDEHIVPEKQKVTEQPSATVSDNPPKTAPIGKSTGISTSVQSTRGPTGDPAEVPPEVDQQIQTPAGNGPNERGSLVGESGNRKIQKRSGPRFGIVEVSSNNMSRTFLIGYSKVEDAKLFCDIIDIHYGHTKMQVNTMKTILTDEHKIEHTFYWVLCKLGFNMALQSLKEKCGNALLKCKYFLFRNITENIETDEEVIKSLKFVLQTLYENNAGFTTLPDLLEKEQKRKDYTQEQSGSKKRKYNFD